VSIAISNINNTGLKTSCQDVSLKSIENELSERWQPRKKLSGLLALSYNNLGKTQKANRIENCGSFLVFRVPMVQPERIAGIVSGAAAGAAAGGSAADAHAAAAARLHSANFCRERLCPMCSWRRSLKIFAHISQILDYLQDEYRYLFLTLTVRNVEGSVLSSTIDRMNEAIKQMFRYLKFVKGYVRVIEVTRNKKNGTYHPHIHMVLAVQPCYFKGDNYIPQNEWLKMWQVYYGDPNITQVDIRAAKNKKTGETSGQNIASAVAEIAKYSCKPSDFIIVDDMDLTDDIVQTLDNALYHRRLITYSGVFNRAAKALNQDDPENGDLVNINDDVINPDLAYMLIRYQWSAGVYKLTGKEELQCTLK
jgi:plasmid rolling circle replication initiator protein Rep